MKCRACQHELTTVFADLGHAPLSNAFVQDLMAAETYYPLKVWTCDHCFLTQTGEYTRTDEIFSADYVYFSSYSTSWLAHAEHYTTQMIADFKLRADSRVIEVAANDGYLLQYFKQAGILTLGIEPTASTAAAARQKGIDMREVFFGRETAQMLVQQGMQADLMAANNVLAHVPDIHDFIAGFKLALKPEGVATFEFPHLLELVRHRQFDTIYHEHFSYLSLLSVDAIVKQHGLRIFRVEKLVTHGGSLRVFVTHDAATHALDSSVEAVASEEQNAGMNRIEFYQNFQPQIDQIRDTMLDFIATARREGKRIAAYGAAAKGNTLLNYCGLRHGVISFVCDRSPHKQGRYLPGSHVPVLPEDALRELRPDYILILPWNLRDEITAQLSYVKEWGAQFVVAVPRLEVFS